ncbi:nuclear transport factor 2 family protein [Winogradskyella maritima]|uniref:Nuclear transport factor 2 family protein n=1 Tax=Winogradskyella maritima TaxID=1517766 RepID=A0ABV8AHV4_9FLAO|nr:nuclear transport factor 2 family protein [Winogradskyella maritima]
MRHLLFFSFILSTSNCVSQTNTDVYLFNINTVDGVSEPLENLYVSNNEGYDNQPSFYDDNHIVFVSTRNNQTDIAIYNIAEKQLKFINDTPNGGEYSPQRIPNSKDISAVRLDNDGKQRLYRYDFETGKSSELIKDLVVAYYTWYDENIIVSAVIEDNNLNLYVSNLKTKTNTKYAENVGRSFHKIPNSNLMSFISKAEEKWAINSINPSNGDITPIMSTLGNAEDMCWLAGGHILIPRKNIIYKFTPKTNEAPSILANFEDNGLQNISRLSTSKNGTMLSVVSDESPETIVQKQLDAYNARDIDAFMATYTEDIKLYNFPNELRSEGQVPMRNRYESFFDNSPDLRCEIQKRIVIGNKVIDHELVTANGNSFKAVAIYEVENGLISKVTFIR